MDTDTKAYYETRFSFDRRREIVWSELCRFLQPRYIPPDATILEIGAGYCHFINQVVGKEKHALDVSIDVESYAAKDVVAHVQTCVSLNGFDGRSIDIVVASNVFEHLSRNELDLAVGEIWRVLRGGGRMIILQPNFKYCYWQYFDDYTHVQIFTDVSLSDYLRSRGFGVVAAWPRFLPFSMHARLPVWRLLVRWYLKFPFKPFAGQMLIIAERPVEA